MKIEFNPETKIWKSLDYTHGEYIKHFIGEIFLENVKKVPGDKVLEWHYDTGVSKTMNEIYRESVTVAINLQRLGIKKGDVVVFYSMVNSKVSSLAMGALMLGAVVNFFETTFSRDAAKYTLNLLNPCVLLYEEKFKSAILDVMKDIKLPCLKYQISIDGKSGVNVDNVLFKSISSFTQDNFRLPNLGDPLMQTAVLLFTSGSTGLPKAVALSHAQMLHGVISFWTQPDGKSILSPDSTIFSLSPIRWISQVDLMLQSLLLGIKRVYASGFPAGEYGREVVRKGKVTHFFSPPSVFKEIILSIEPYDLDALSSVKFIYLGGEDPGQTVIDMSRNLAPQATIMRCYGMTELAGLACCDQHINGGYIVPGVEIKLLDDNLKPVGPNEKGQLCFRFPMPFLGYHKIDNSKIYYSDGFLNTGDYGYMDDNKALHVLARYKDLVRTKEVILIPSEVEKLVCTLSSIFASTLVGYRTSNTDVEDKGALYIVKQLQNTQANENEMLMAGQNQEIENEVLKVEVKKLLEKHLKCNESCIIRLVNIIEKLPLTSCGKVDKPALIQLAKSLDME
ncbi:probable 4-coumarate--CoA ligase 3 [Lucilia sericata]|uniref:probable 4-coumarate--CoA ligase 3 n=1 Tax=Lucilia sericata TaxID=13632 RepID=UPI0018A84C35|nr:probable 4-coumarate--CoA ligase 3 [Lucilia sericata]